MTIVNLTRNIYQGGQNVKRAVNLHRYMGMRAATVTTGNVQFETPELAKARPFDEMPTTPTVPILGGSWMYLPIIGKYSLQKGHLSDRDKNMKYGDVVREKFGNVNFVSAFTPEAQEVISLHEGKYPNRGTLNTLKAYRESRPQWYNTTGVLVLTGKDWWDLRAKTQKHLMKPKAIEAYLDPMQDVARDLVHRIYDKRDGKNEVDGFLEDLYKWALESVAYVGLDTRLGCLTPKLSPDSDAMKLIDSVQTQFDCMNKLEGFTGNVQFWKYFPSPTWKKFAKACDDFTVIAFKYINRSLAELQKRADEDRDLTMLQNMLMTKDLDVSGAMVTVADMLFAGIDTTSHSVGFLLYNLAKNPDKQKILAEEVRQLLPDKERRITPEVFKQFHYLKACMKESMRLFPIARGNARTLEQDVVISGYRVPAGTIIIVLQQQIFRNEKYFKNADQFLPERWLNKDEKLQNFYSYVPFGVGIRSCIGRRLAELEIICLVTEIIRKFNVEYHHEDIDLLTRLVNVPDRPLKFSFLDR